MGGCREHHNKYEHEPDSRELLKEVHLKFMAENVVNPDPLPEPEKKSKRKQLYTTFKKHE